MAKCLSEKKQREMEERGFWKGSSAARKGKQRGLVIGFRILGQATFDRPQILKACSIRSGYISTVSDLIVNG